MRLPQGLGPINLSLLLPSMSLLRSSFSITNTQQNLFTLWWFHSWTCCLCCHIHSQRWNSWLSYSVCRQIRTLSSLPWHVDIGVFSSLTASGRPTGSQRILQAFVFHSWYLVWRLWLPTIDSQLLSCTQANWLQTHPSDIRQMFVFLWSWLPVSIPSFWIVVEPFL